MRSGFNTVANGSMLSAFDVRAKADERFSQKLTKTPMAVLNEASQSHIASLTADFSYAYLKEAYVSALLSLARRTATESEEVGQDNESEVFFVLLQQQIETLRAEMSAQAVHK
jgi:hypothetical protein